MKNETRLMNLGILGGMINSNHRIDEMGNRTDSVQQKLTSYFMERFTTLPVVVPT